jgi:hypothetical protein
MAHQIIYDVPWKRREEIGEPTKHAVCVADSSAKAPNLITSECLLCLAPTSYPHRTSLFCLASGNETVRFGVGHAASSGQRAEYETAREALQSVGKEQRNLWKTRNRIVEGFTTQR